MHGEGACWICIAEGIKSRFGHATWNLITTSWCKRNMQVAMCFVCLNGMVCKWACKWQIVAWMTPWPPINLNLCFQIPVTPTSFLIFLCFIGQLMRAQVLNWPCLNIEWAPYNLRVLICLDGLETTRKNAKCPLGAC